MTAVPLELSERELVEMEAYQAEHLGMYGDGCQAQHGVIPAATRSEILLAREAYGSDDVQIDDNALASRAEDGSGVWVSAWVWLPRELAEDLGDKE